MGREDADGGWGGVRREPIIRERSALRPDTGSMIREDFAVQHHVDRLLAEHATGTRFTPLTHRGSPLSMDEAYAVQEALAAALSARRGSPVGGFKIGLTSSVMQQMCGIDRPVYGAIFADSFHESGHRLDLSNHGRVGVEFEIAVELGRALPPPDRLTRASAAECVACICPAIEIVDDRHADYATLDAASLTADNSWNAGAVLGARQPLPDDLATRAGHVWCDGKLVAEGLAGAVLGHPLEVIVWMAKELALTGKAMPAGSIVMTGSIVKTQFVVPGQRWIYEVAGLGQVELRC